VKHEPVDRLNCGACHLAHGSVHKELLLKGQPDLCLMCHSEKAEYWKSGVAHDPAKKDCSLCHNSHASDYPAILKTRADAVCAGCHKGDTAFLNAHRGIKPGPGSCLGCHDPHGGPDSSLLYPVSHAPFEQGNCRPCHPGRAK
jgi:predicted CXXCH cytochrome family protein